MPNFINKCYNCFWWSCWACDGIEYIGEDQDEPYCDWEMNVNHPDFERYNKEYNADINEALKPVYEWYKTRFEAFKKVKNAYATNNKN